VSILRGLENVSFIRIVDVVYCSILLHWGFSSVLFGVSYKRSTESGFGSHFRPYEPARWYTMTRLVAVVMGVALVFGARSSAIRIAIAIHLAFETVQLFVLDRPVRDYRRQLNIGPPSPGLQRRHHTLRRLVLLHPFVRAFVVGTLFWLGSISFIEVHTRNLEWLLIMEAVLLGAGIISLLQYAIQNIVSFDTSRHDALIAIRSRLASGRTSPEVAEEELFALYVSDESASMWPISTAYPLVDAEDPDLPG
jgi:hypothetical protein